MKKIDSGLQKRIFFVYDISALISVVFSSAGRFRNIPAFELEKPPRCLLSSF